KVYNRFDCHLPRGQWLPVALTWDGIHFRVYADGKRVYEERASFTQAADNGAPLRFGLGQDQEQERGFEGEMRRLAVWRRALTEEEIRKLQESRE
ncbi:MAG TPA: LamG-like jellyroll fold domain-containing protein, partial [Armatimonadota bacterium]|nr:LamG-like jellyroll fold domain-containing protein [Armatimonadota bacterium]